MRTPPGRGFWRWRSRHGWELWVHGSCAVMAGAVSWLFAARLGLEYPDLAPLYRWLLAGIAGLVPVAAIAAHEAGHLVAGRRLGLAPTVVVLNPFGAGTVLPGQCPTPQTEAAFALAGPAASLAMAMTAVITAGLLPPGPSQIPARLAAAVNLVLAAASLLPSFPLDGGLAFRALRWQITGDRARATRESKQLGRATGLALMALGGLLLPRFAGWALLLGALLVLLGPGLARRSRTSILDVAGRRTP